MLAIGAGGLLGPLDLAGQVHAPYPVAHLFNSPAVWAAAAFMFGWWARELVASITGAVIVLVVGVEAYYLADVLVRGASRSNLTSSAALAWLGAGVVAGVVFGTAGSWASERSGWRAMAGRAALPSVFGSEAVYNLARIVTEPAGGRPDDLGQFAVLLLVLALLVLTVVLRGIPRPMVVRVIAAVAGAAAVIGLAANQLL
jgi:hypothetical protein